MNTFLQFSIITGILANLCACSSVRTIALVPKGLRACIPHERGIESFTFYGYVSGSGSRPVRTRFEGEAREPSDGLWCYHNNKVSLSIGNDLVYWYRVVKHGITKQSETMSKKLQAADFLDESGLYAHRTETPPLPNSPANNFQDDQIISHLRPSNGAEIQIAQPLRPGYTIPSTTERPLQTFNIGEGVRRLCQAGGNTDKNKGFGYAPFPPLDVDPENMSSDNGDLRENLSPKIDIRIGDSIHIDILIEKKINPCDEHLSNPQKTAEIDDRIRAEFFSKLNIQNQTCENLIVLEKKFSKSVLSSLEGSILKTNSLEDTLDDTKIELKYYKQIAKELLKIIDSLKDKTTNKLILQSSVPLVDYRRTLRDVLELMLDMKPGSYNIVKSDVEGNKTISFELSNYGQKLQIFLAGRIKLPNTRFEMFDFDLVSELV